MTQKQKPEYYLAKVKMDCSANACWGRILIKYDGKDLSIVKNDSQNIEGLLESSIEKISYEEGQKIENKTNKPSSWHG